MTRVAFVMASPGQGWLGGLSYFRNLFQALRALPASSIEPVIITDPHADEKGLESFQPIEIVRTSLVDTRTPWWKVRRALQLYCDRDWLFERFLRRHRIDLLSHSGYLGRKCRVPALAWIPDFQELHLPEFFSPAERGARARNVEECCRHATAVLLSSQSARVDLEGVSGQCGARAYVLPFVASVPARHELPTVRELEQRHGFRGRFFHLPNQFWAHKNHATVIEALRRLKDEGLDVLVLATGNTADHRQPEHFAQLMALAAARGVADRFRVLGVVPYLDLMGLMAASVAVINPSLFEGWSTTVEEAKSLGKAVILSDIPVHHEQAPEGGVYFPPTDPIALAACLWQIWSRKNEPEIRSLDRVFESLQERRGQFGRGFEHIVAELTVPNSRS